MVKPKREANFLVQNLAFIQLQRLYKKYTDIDDKLLVLHPLNTWFYGCNLELGIVETGK